MKRVKLFKISTEDTALYDNQSVMYFREAIRTPHILKVRDNIDYYIDQKTYAVKVMHIGMNGKSYYGVIDPELQPFVDVIVQKEVLLATMPYRQAKREIECTLTALQSEVKTFNELPWYKRIFKKVQL
jgi:Tfp pilus assembly ATPase PilU